MTANSVEGLAELLCAIQPHDRLSSWLKGDGIDRALKAMNISAASKKPGRVLKRVGNELGDIFRSPRVVSWDKATKTVHASATSRAQISDVALDLCGLDDAETVFQTDLYFRANKDVTEVNASVVAAITAPAMQKLAGLRGGGDGDIDRTAARAMALARVLQTGASTAGFDERAGYDHLIPDGDVVMKAVSLPIMRTEFDKEIVGRFVLLVDAAPFAEASGEDAGLLEKLAKAMTKDGHPGEEAFAALVRSSARHRGGAALAAE